MSASRIGRYEITSTLGKGAMGVVYKAVDPTIGRTVALKTTRLDVHATDAEELLARFRNEARLAGVLNHPNIVTVYDAGEFEGLFYIAMEFIQGETLHQVLAKKKPLPVEQVIGLSRQVCAGLDEAASHRVVHRDIKPANIMLANGSAKIMDFGIAKAGGDLTSTGQVLGTPNYMSPEQVRGKPLDGRSDLFSYGVILYEMVTGARPFQGDNVTTIIYKIINEEPRSPHDVNEAVPAGLSAVIMKALAKNPNARYQLGAQLVKDLDYFQARSAAPESSTMLAGSAMGEDAAAAGQAAVVAEKAASTVRRLAQASKAKVPLWPILAGALLALALVAAGILAYVKHTQARQQAELERLLSSQGAPLAAAKPAAPGASLANSAPGAAPPPTQQKSKPPVKEREDAKAVIARAAPAAAAPPGGADQLPAPTVATGELVLDTHPQGAQVEIDGRGDPTWRTPFHPLGILPGPHTVTFTLNGYAGETRIIRVEAGRQAFVAATLKLRSGLVDWTSTPAGADIVVDGVASGQRTPARLRLTEGAHSIVLHKSGYSDFSTTVHVKTGRSYSYTAQLPGGQSGLGRLKQMLGGGDKVQLRVSTTPAGARVRINGAAQAHASPLRLRLEPGVYDLTLELRGYQTVRKTITIEQKTPLAVDETLQKLN